MAGGDSHWREWSINSLKDVERKVDAQDIICCRCSGRQREECRYRSRLGEPEVFGGVDCPLYILWRTIVNLDLRSQVSQCSYLLISETSLVELRCLLDALRTSSFHGLDSYALVTNAAFDNLTSSSIGHEVVGVDRTRDHGLTQTIARIDHCLAALARQWISCEEDT